MGLGARMIAVASLIAMLSVAAPWASQGRANARWTEPWSEGKAVYELDVSYRNVDLPSTGLSYRLDFRVRRSGDADRRTSRWEESEEGERVEWAFPIRVQGDPAPQVLVCQLGPWGYSISGYSMGVEDCRCLFGFPVREQAAARWRCRSGALTGFTVLDRWDPEGVKRESPQAPGIRWERVISYRYDKRKRLWVASRLGWRAWDVNNKSDDLGKDMFAGERDCPFSFTRRGGSRSGKASSR